MKNFKKLSRENLKSISGGKSCTSSCSDGGIVFISSCSSCIQYSGGAACYDANAKGGIRVENCT
ncbi:bacteriocin-like protein [Chryseobacterium sp. JK1]|uniref:bacteriocin-like protein n=1 Tax=Chryseobacterium sp. JK1 TaxID=874294 RepID=UPI003D693BB6